MSKSNPTIENPCKKFIELKSDKGQLFFWNKEKEENIEIPVPCYFVVLDELSTITGYNKKNDCGIYSNEVHSVVTEILRVKTFKGGESIIGKYSDIKDSIKALGGKFTKSVYAMLISPEGGEPEMVNFKFRGAAFSAWLDKKLNTMNSVIGLIGFTEEKNGNTTYQVPVFKAFRLSDEQNKEAIVMDEILQAYLKVYKSQEPEKEIAKAEAVEVIPEGNGQWQGLKEKIVAKSKAEASEELDDLPF